MKELINSSYENSKRKWRSRHRKSLFLRILLKKNYKSTIHRLKRNIREGGKGLGIQVESQAQKLI